MRRFLIAGNWKMHNGPAATRSLLTELNEEVPDIPDSLDALVCPPFVSLEAASEKVRKHFGLFLGAQNLHFEDEGAYTGEVTADMLKEVGCEYVIVGHSERREYFGETDKTVNLKVKKAVSEGIKPIFCVGESLKQRKAGEHVNLVKKQVQVALNEVEASDAEDVVVAYEPLWAIGTGETATPEQAQEMHDMIRGELAELYDEDTSDAIRILYGGSMKPHNAEDLLGQPDVDGGLIGGASLKAESFADIIRIAEELS
ncbi:triose-phosphate isomerase [Aliifodinibius sp. S!AR15-10]|uniref:triose-phosphate isomerase n=1 Tax=Aliifodinibius sp. S!AR15-10 TaxID=2950437 RepID=UPI00285EAB50|nr:triose-phosphate isomerase [Aliifodinibius sp. S!AR15-10]MDR8391102.1 triose-phosphate isomerase [Aliifodinibius sp. S!AR15-10]